jgi:membrane protease YdiL (CAAX protease family)
MHLPSALSGIENWMRISEDKATELTEAFTQGTSVGTLIINLIVIALMAALSEELFFRGMLQKVLLECFKNKHIAIWIGAALFSAFHMQFFGFLPRMVMGAFLGYLFLWSGSLWPSIFAHFINNGTAVVLIWLSNRGAISKDIDKVGMESTELIYVVASAIVVISCLFLIYKIEKNCIKKTDTKDVPAF